MRIGFVELVLLLFIASITVGPNVALFADRWLRRAQRTSAAAARRKAQLEAQAAIEREALMTRFRVASNIFALLMLAALAYGLLLRPIDTPPKAYTAPDVRQDTGAAQTALSADSKDSWKQGGYLGVDCVRTQDGLVYAAAYNGAAMKKRQSDLVRTDGGHYAAILSVEGELTSFAFDADGDLWLTVVTSSGGALCRARHDSWGTSVEQVVTQIDGAPLGVLSAVETGPDGKVYFAVSTEAAAKNGLESALRTELIAHTGTGCVYVYDPSARTVEQVLGGVAGAAGLALSEDGRTLYVSDLGNRCIWSVAADDLAGRAAHHKDIALFQLCLGQQLRHSLPRFGLDLLFELFRHKKHLVLYSCRQQAGRVCRAEIHFASRRAHRRAAVQLSA